MTDKSFKHLDLMLMCSGVLKFADWYFCQYRYWCAKNVIRTSIRFAPKQWICWQVRNCIICWQQGQINFDTKMKLDSIADHICIFLVTGGQFAWQKSQSIFINTFSMAIVPCEMSEELEKALRLLIVLTVLLLCSSIWEKTWSFAHIISI